MERATTTDLSISNASGCRAETKVERLLGRGGRSVPEQALPLTHWHPTCARPAPAPPPERALWSGARGPIPRPFPAPGEETEWGRAAGGAGALGGGTPGSAALPPRTAPCAPRGHPQPAPATARTLEGLGDLVSYSRRLYFRGESPVVGRHTTQVLKAKTQRRGWTGARESCFLLSWRDGLRRGARKNKRPALRPPRQVSLKPNQMRAEGAGHSHPRVQLRVRPGVGREAPRGGGRVPTGEGPFGGRGWNQDKSCDRTKPPTVALLTYRVPGTWPRKRAPSRSGTHAALRSCTKHLLRAGVRPRWG